MEYERIRDKIADMVEPWVENKTSRRLIASQILSLDGIRLEADNQDPNESSHFIWPQTTQSKEEMRRYQTGEITKEEHEWQRRQIFDEELAIYMKAQQDMLTPDSEGNVFVKCRKKEEK